METFTCDLCNYKTFRKYDFNKHLNTKRHKSRKISLSLSSCDKKNSESRFSQNFQTKVSPNEPKWAKKSEKRQKSEPKHSPNEPKLAKKSENDSRNIAQMSPNGLAKKASKKSENPENLFNFPIVFLSTLGRFLARK